MDHKTSGLRATVNAAIWNVSLSSMPSWKVFIVQPIRLIIVLARDLAYGQLTLRAMGLVYTTMLSLVPLLALSFSVLKAFGVYNRIDTLLLGFLAPLGARSTEVTLSLIHI